MLPDGRLLSGRFLTGAILLGARFCAGCGFGARVDLRR